MLQVGDRVKYAAWHLAGAEHFIRDCGLEPEPRLTADRAKRGTVRAIDPKSKLDVEVEWDGGSNVRLASGANAMCFAGILTQAEPIPKFQLGDVVLTIGFVDAASKRVISPRIGLIVTEMELIEVAQLPPPNDRFNSYWRIRAEYPTEHGYFEGSERFFVHETTPIRIGPYLIPYRRKELA